jgi:ribosome-binding ATPase YchF (GTP1/OBG family)
MKLFQLLTAKPVLFACNVAEGDLATAEQNPFVRRSPEYVRTHHDAAYVPISAKIEAELIDLPPEERRRFSRTSASTTPASPRSSRAPTRCSA